MASRYIRADEAWVADRVREFAAEHQVSVASVSVTYWYGDEEEAPGCLIRIYRNSGEHNVGWERHYNG